MGVKGVPTSALTKNMTENHEAREAELRINEADRAAIKRARNECFDPATPMGFVARKACQELLESDDSEGVSIA